ncbi:MAG: S8 family serine peptidase [Ignavibacteria bacterium]
MKIQNKTAKRIFLFLIPALCFTLFSFKPFDSESDKNSLQRAFENRITQGDLPDWTLLDPEKDGYEGVRTNSFYQYLNTLGFVPQRKEVIVGVIDSGFDIEHPDLKENIWINEAEMNGSTGVDDDSNGYIDDLHGWNFLGKAKYLSLEVSREYFRLKKLKTPDSDPYFRKVKDEFEKKQDETISTAIGVKETLDEIIKAETILKEKNITTDPKKLMEISNDLKGKYQDAASMILGVYMLYGSDRKELEELNEEYGNKVKVLFDSTETYKLIGDNPDEMLETTYGNNDVVENTEIHGTHVSGIIGSKKTGQAPFVKIMCLRAVPNEGDERDKDIGNAIRYAVDNGASIINLSAGKYFSPDPGFVVDAIKYAEDKGVLFVVSAGNEGDDISNIVNYPRKFIEETGEKKYFTNMIVVGANSWMKQWNQEKDPENQNSKFDLVAPFSNYSKTVVDIFAPGVQINSTAPNGKYKRIGGTSMAAPVVAGIAAVLKAYYPQLTAGQLKEAIMSSARQYDGLKVKLKGKSSKELFSGLSKSGGVIDLINAFKKAREISGEVN